MRKPTEVVLGELNGHEIYASGYFEAGYPEKRYLANGDPGYPGAPDSMIDMEVYLYYEGLQKDENGNKTYKKDDEGNFIKEKNKVYLDEYLKFFEEEVEEALLEQFYYENTR